MIAPTLHLPVPAIDLRHLEAATADRELSRLAVEDAHRPFDLAIGPLLRVTLVRLRDDDCALLLTMHHIVCDGWSIALFALGSPGCTAPSRRACHRRFQSWRWIRRFLAVAAADAER